MLQLILKCILGLYQNNIHCTRKKRSGCVENFSASVFWLMSYQEIVFFLRSFPIRHTTFDVYTFVQPTRGTAVV